MAPDRPRIDEAGDSYAIPDGAVYAVLFDPAYIRVMKALVGDGNEYPGCPKFGPKKWEALLERYGSALPVLDSWMETRNLDELKDDVADFPPFQLVLNNLDLVYTSYQLAKLRPDWVNLLRVPSLVSYIDPANAPSRALAERLAGRRMGVRA